MFHCEFLKLSEEEQNDQILQLQAYLLIIFLTKPAKKSGRITLVFIDYPTVYKVVQISFTSTSYAYTCISNTV